MSKDDDGASDPTGDVTVSGGDFASVLKELMAGQSAESTNPYAGIDVYTGGTAKYPNQSGNFNVNVTGPPISGPKRIQMDKYAEQHLYTLSQEELQALQQQLEDAGYLPSGNVTGLFNSDTIQAYGSLLQDVDLANDNGQMLTPEQYLAQSVQRAKEDGTGLAGTRTSSSVSLSSGQDAYQAAESAFQQLLGRDPKKKDVAALHGALNAYERAHATSTTTTTDAKGNSSSTTSGGTSSGYADTSAEDYATKHYGGEAAGVQIDRLASAFEQMLGG